jgi:hypothetical protein
MKKLLQNKEKSGKKPLPFGSGFGYFCFSNLE